MSEIPARNPDEVIVSKIFKAQYNRALKYSVYTPESDKLSPTEEYLAILKEYGLPYLPEEVMKDLEAVWLKNSQIALTGLSMMSNRNGKLGSRLS